MCMAGLVTAETPWETFGRELTEPYGYAPGDDPPLDDFRCG
jgi:hypothetical protein